MLPKPKQFVTMPYSLYRDIRKMLESERDQHIYKDQIRMRFDIEYNPNKDTRDSVTAKKIAKILVDMDRQSMLEERL